MILQAKKETLKEGLYKGFKITKLFKSDGSLYAVIPASMKQPKKNKKKISINCFTFKLSWI